MRAVIMAGGFGTRLRPLSINIPKPMVPVATLPMMEHVVTLLRQHGLTEITALLYYQPDVIRDYFGDGSRFEVRMSYCLPDDDYGTAGAVRAAVGDTDEEILVISGDLITDFNLTHAIQWHQEKEAEATILLTRAENPLAYGIVITDDNGRIVRFLEKPSWGEAFSDTINTGIYLLRPSAIREIPKRMNFDFSQNLFPLMLSRGMRLFGKVMDGYWKDVGNVGEYHRVHHDVFTGVVSLDLHVTPVQHEGYTLYRRESVELDPSVQLSGMVILAADVVVGPGSSLHNVAIGPRARIGEGCQLRDAVVWEDAVIGDRSRLTGAVVCRRVTIGADAQLFDGAIVSDESTVGDGATVKAGVRIWPGKTVDSAAIVSTSVIWGDRWNRELFTDSKVTGLALTEMTPEMCVRLGAALGAFLGTQARVLTSRDASDVTRLLRRSLISGLLAAGVDVSDLESLPAPVLRFGLAKGGYTAGLFARHNPDDHRLIDFILLDGSGMDMPTAKLKKIERNYFGEDFERAGMDDIGRLDTPQRVLETYQQEFLQAVDAELIRGAGFKVVVDYSNGASAQVFPNLPSMLGLNTVELNATPNPRRFLSAEETDRALVQLAAIVKSLRADIGLMIHPAAEKLMVVDERGRPVDSQSLLLAVTELFLSTHPARQIAVPVSASMGVEEIAQRHGVAVERVAESHLAMMEIFRQPDVDFVGGTRGGFLFPGFQIAADAVFAAAKILEMLARTRMRIGELQQRFNRYVRRSVSVPCPWNKKGQVMRRLITESADKDRQLIDGVRIFDNGGWVLITPDRVSASFNVTAESTSEKQTGRLIERYRKVVDECQRD